MKPVYKAVLVAYLAFLLWLLLFKFSFDFSVVLDRQQRSFNVLPFAAASRGSVREMVDNFAVFVPLGLLVGVNFKRFSFWQKLAGVFLLSFAAEMLQFILAIGITDITDIITNTLGGCFGLALYGASRKLIRDTTLDRIIAIIIAALLIAFMLLRVLVFKVKY